MAVADTLTLGEYLGGALYACVSIGFPLAAAWLLARKRLRELTGAVFCLGFGILAIAAVAAVHLLPAALGLLSRASVAIAATLALAGAAALAGPSTRPPDPARAPASLPDRWMLVGLAAALICVALYLALALHLAGGPPTNVDTLTFHLPGVAAWIQEGSIWSIDQFVPDQAHGYYPHNGNLLELAAVLPWDSPFLIRLVDLPLVAIAALGVYAGARELSVPRSSAMAAAAAVCSLPAVSIYAVEKPLPDAMMLAGFAAGGCFLVRHARTAATADLVLAGIGLGIAFGSKWYGVSSVLVVLAVWLGGQLLARRGLPALARRGGLLGGLVLAGGGVWLLRNLIESGNPVFPAELAPLGVTIFDSPPDPLGDRLGSTIADYIGDAAAWSDYILPAFADFLGFAGPLLGLGLLACLATVSLRLRRGAEPADRAVLACCVCGLLLAGVYAITPFSALGPPGRPDGVGVNTRYLVPGLLVAAACTAALLGRLGPRARLAGEAALLLAVVDGARRTSDLPPRTVALGLAAACLGAAALWLLARLRAAGSRAPAPRPAAAAALGLGAILALAAGYELQSRYLDVGYVGQDPALDRVLIDEAAGSRIGLAGEWDVRGLQPVLPAFGPRFENHVRYLGATREGMLRTYRSQAAFSAALRDGGYDLLLVGRARSTPPSRTIVAWARATGYREAASSERFVLLNASARGDR